nr:50S ribosomal protein L9 [Mycoplasmopsis caviae]
MIKDCEKGKANTIIEVSAGYGNNFLIAKGLAVAYNEKNKKELEKRLSELTNNEMEKRAEALTLKGEIEKLTLKYSLDAHIDNNGNLIAHGAISTKDIVKTLVSKGYKLDKYAVQKVHLVSNGTHDIDVILYKDIVAKLKVEVIINAK